MPERRDGSRYPLQKDCVLEIEGRPVSARVENLSRKGCLFRIMAGGALSGTADRHPTASRSVVPIATEPEYAADVARARRLAFLVEDGSVGSLAEAAIRFAVGTPGISTALIGVSSPEQLEQAVEFTNRGPLAAGVLARIHDAQMRPE